MKKFITLAFAIVVLGAAGNAPANNFTISSNYYFNDISRVQLRFMKFDHILLSEENDWPFAENTKMFTQSELRDISVYKIHYDVPIKIGKFINVLDMDDDKLLPETKANKGYDVYLNSWHSLEQTTVDAVSAYRTFNKNNIISYSAPHFSDELKPGTALLLGDIIKFYKKDNTIFANNTSIYPDIIRENSLTSSRLFALYRDYDISDKLNICGYVGYAESLIDIPNDKWNGATAWEISFKAAYKLSPDIKYNFGAGLAKLEWGGDTPDPGTAYKLFNRLTVGF